MTTLSRSDEGKDVVSSDGQTVGTVTEVSHGTAHVDPDPGVAPELKTALGWGESDDRTYPIAESDVATVTDDELRLDRGD